ncbi:MAG TPA: hypothetical protein VGM24_10420 [Puia sp.]|jgi:hypothetical protein
MERKRNRFYFIPIIIALIFLMGWVVMLLWNAILPDLINVRSITYEQALGLLILCKILFGSYRPGPSRGFGKGGPHWRSKLMDLSPEERERFKQEWRNRAAGKDQP